MEVVDKVRGFLAIWDKGGEEECRKFLTPMQANPSDAHAADSLATAYHTLLSATLSTWTPSAQLSPAALVAFVQSTIDALPSSSHDASPAPASAAAIGEMLVDTIWAADAQLDEVLADAKATEHAQGDAKDTEAAGAAKKNAEQDKETLVEVTKQFLHAGVLDPGVCRERLDLLLVAHAGLITDKPSFDRKEIRTRTGLFYKQNKFNLLREQSEGFSKLITEVTSSLPPPHASGTGRPTESFSQIVAHAQPVWERVVSLIGYFDLDPNRALDVILDVFSVHLTTHWSFFLVLLGLSPWKGDSNRTGWDFVEARGKASENGSERSPYKGMSLDDVLSVAEEQDVGGIPKSTKSTGARVMAQVLGFKFRHYQSLEVTEPAPRNLYLLAALLIREGFITLEDLLPHIAPSDEEMEQKEYKAYLASVDARIAGAKISQLAMAAPLESSTSQSGSKLRAPAQPEPKPAAPEVKAPPNQRAGLLNALLSVGALRQGFAILSQHRWLVDAHPEVADLIIRIVKHSIAPMYETFLVTKERKPSYTQPRPRYSPGGLVLAPTRRPVLTLWAPTPPCTSAVDFVYFFPNWTDRVPVCVKLNDLVDVVEPLLAFVGLHVSRDPIFLTKFLRLGRLHIQSSVESKDGGKKPFGQLEPDHPVRQFWFKILRVYLLPALPLIRGNAVCTVEIWNIIRQFETTVRWRLYGEWKSKTYQSHPELRVRAVQADRESKGILRRLSHNTIDTLSGTVAKLAHSNPCIFFRNAVNQIMAYDNLAGVVIQALRYVTNMGFDVLVYIILEALSNPNKERVKSDGVNTSDWLQSLASFTGMLFRRYSADITPLLKYIVHQLYNNQTTEIVVLRELIWKLAGIEPLPSLSDSQVAAMAGGPTLRIEAVASTTRGARLDPSEVFKGPQRLGKALLDSSLALPLLIQVAQQRQSAVYQTADAHLKSIASLYDTTHGVLLQYLELLNSPQVIPPSEYAEKVVPSLADLGQLYGIGAPICMQIMRPIWHSALLKAALAKEEQDRLAGVETEKRLKAALAAKRDPSSGTSRIASPAVGETNGHAESAEAKPVSQDAKPAEDVVMENATAPAPAQAESPWVPQIEALFEDVKKIAPPEAVDVIGPAFYLTFWQLSTYDLSPPASKYDEECAALRTLSRQEDSKYISADRSSDRARRQSAYVHRSRRDRYNQFVDTLSRELKEQTISRMYTIKRLNKEKAHWFTHSNKAAQLSSAIIEHCIQPRCLLSPMDADFCAQFIKVIHTLGTPGFSTLMVYDRLLGDHIKNVVFSCSEYEARNYGRFLLGILTDVHKWYQDEQVYMQDNRVKASGKAVWLPGFQRQWTFKENIEPSAILSWTNFQSVVKKWHRKLHKSLAECIKTGEFMHVYNTIIVLKEILPVFPLANILEYAGSHLSNVLDHLLKTEERGDLKILARAYHASLLKREQYWAMPKSAISKPGNAASVASPRPGSSSPAPIAAERPRTGAPANGPPAATPSQVDKARNVAAPTPSAPRAQLGTTNGNGSVPNHTKLAMNSIPRPEVVKRVRTEPRAPTPTQPSANGKPGETPMDIDVNANSPSSDSRLAAKDALAAANALRPSPRPAGNASSPRPDTPGAPGPRKPVPQSVSRPHTPTLSVSTNVPPTGKLPPQSPRSHRMQDTQQQKMPPPSVPSQTGTAQGFREGAKQVGRKSDEDERGHRMPPSEPRHASSGSRAPSPTLRRRSQSPPTRPGTRNHSSDSRRSRSDRGEGERGERESKEGRSSERREASSHRNERRERTSTRENERERDKDRGRDRHGDRERERDRDRERDREPRDRERDRDRGERERERGDRHRRDEKDRDRESRKEREAASRGLPPAGDDRSMPSRADPSRHRTSSQTQDDSLGKRRRPVDDDPDRASKRSAREKGHREERSRRSSEKDHERPREERSDRRRRERDVPEGGALPDKAGEKRIPEGPASGKTLPPTTPSAPRAMSSTEMLRSAKSEPRERERGQNGSQDPPLPPLPQEPTTGSGSGSLRSRIGEREAPPPPLLPRAPQAPSSYNAPSPAERERARVEDERDGARKRTVSEREKDAPGEGGGGDAVVPPKRPRIIRNRYPTASAPHAIARKLLPIDPQAGERSGRKD